MITASEIRLMLSVLCYHDDLQRAENPDYAGSSFEQNSKDSICELEDLLERMINSDRRDFIGGEI